MQRVRTAVKSESNIKVNVGGNRCRGQIFSGLRALKIQALFCWNLVYNYGIRYFYSVCPVFCWKKHVCDYK